MVVAIDHAVSKGLLEFPGVVQWLEQVLKYRKASYMLYIYILHIYIYIYIMEPFAGERTHKKMVVAHIMALNHCNHGGSKDHEGLINCHRCRRHLSGESLQGWGCLGGTPIGGSGACLVHPCAG